MLSVAIPIVINAKCHYAGTQHNDTLCKTLRITTLSMIHFTK